MDSKIARLRYGGYLTGLLLLIMPPVAVAAPRFVTGANVTQTAEAADISIQFACGIEYVSHLPNHYGDKLRVEIESTAICTGVPPTVAYARERHRPMNAEQAKLLELDYDGDSSSGQTLTLAFSEVVRFEVLHEGAQNQMIVRVRFAAAQAEKAPPEASRAAGVRVASPPLAQPEYVINLSSSRKPHAASDTAGVEFSPGLKLFETPVVLAGATWYRLRLGSFRTSEEARIELIKLRENYPTAWIDRAVTSTSNVEAAQSSGDDTDVVAAYTPNNSAAAIGLDRIDQLMVDARKAMVAGERSRAIQIYTKVLRVADHDRHAEAQEFLALAREKNGQMAHAKAEYQRYLSLYPNSEGAGRVSQRLAVLLAGDRQASRPADNAKPLAGTGSKPRQSDWRVQTFFSQYYRRDVNQINEEEEIVSQSSLYSDINLDARRRGKRFDFSSRLSAGYRNDFLGEDEGSGNDIRVSYAYADLADAKTGLRGRIGRQSRNSGGVLGRFDGLNLGYYAGDRIVINAVAGQPVISASDGLDSEKTFYGASVNYGPILENLELGLFYIQQDIDGIDDRQAVGGEFRYFGENQSFWGLIDYDTSFSELSSAFLQGSWRFASRLSIHGSIDQRHSPYLSTSNALIGQPVQDFSELLILFTEDEIHRFSVDRAPVTQSYTLGLSYSISPRFQINADANQTSIDASPESGGVAATPQSTYRYFSTNLVASSLFKEGDVSMISLRASDSDSSRVLSLNLDSRFPIGRAWRINPRIRVDRREIMSDSSFEWLYTPGIRIQYRRSQKFRLELEAGKRFTQRDLGETDLDRESYFVNVGYQAFF